MLDGKEEGTMCESVTVKIKTGRPIIVEFKRIGAGCRVKDSSSDSITKSFSAEMIRYTS
jgi:hypothetical protein